MGSLIISLIFTFNTLLVLAASFPWGRSPWPPSFPGWTPFYKPPAVPSWPPSPGFPGWTPSYKPPPVPGWPPSPGFPGRPPFTPPSPSGNFPGGPPSNTPPPSPPSFKLPPLNATTFHLCMIGSPPFSDFYDPNIDKTSFTTVLNSTAQNFRCLGNSTRKPIFILRPTEENQVPLAVRCAQLFNLNIRTRSGGHDYECLSYISLIQNQQFMILDLFNLRDVTIDTPTKTAWVQAGATIGEFYYKVSQASKNLAFPAGLCSSLGVGGHLTGGAYGSMMRMFGLGADNVLDVRMIDAGGFVRSKEFGNMDDDLFWALSGGGGGSFGIILAWKVQLVTLPSSKVTMFTVVNLIQPNQTGILEKWQSFAPYTDPKLFIRIIMQTIPNTAVLTIYQALYLGRKGKLVNLMKSKFPELGVTTGQCNEMSWIESVLAIAGFNTSVVKPDFLLQGKPAFPTLYFKAKSDFVMTPLSTEAIEGLLTIFMEQGPPSLMVWNPYGGRMAEIEESAIPFPHRKAMMKIQYVATWSEDRADIQLKMEDWMRRIYEHMRDHVSKNPREAYVNYRDLDVGKMEGTGSNCSYPTIWGPKYFKGNFPRLVDVKSRVDPSNFFKNEQSIPTRWMLNQCTEVI